MSGSVGRQPGATRVRLLDATVRVGARDGWGGVTTRAVATEAGVNQGLVHYHFGSVDVMRRAAADHVVDSAVVDALAGLGDSSDPVAAVVGVLDVVTSDRAHRDASVFLYEAWLAARRDEDLREWLARSAQRTRADLTAWLDRLTAGRTDRADPEAVAILLAAVLDGLYLQRLVDPALDTGVVAGLLGRLLGSGPPPGPGDGGSRDS